MSRENKAVKQPEKRRERDFNSRLIIFLILLAAAIVVVIPYVWMLSNSFKSSLEAIKDPMHLIPQEATLYGYKKVLTESPFFKWLANSVIVTGVNTLIILFTSTLVGYVFSRYRFKGKEFIFSLLMFTMMVPAQVTMITTFIIIDGVGLYDSLLALIIPSFVNVFGIYLCKQSCDEIPRELIESAKIDGEETSRSIGR